MIYKYRTSKLSVSNTDSTSLEQQILTLQEEVKELRNKNTDLNERLKAYSLINTGQISLINKLIDKVPFGVMLIDEGQRILHANAAARKIFSTEAFEMTGQPSDKYFKYSDEKKNSTAVNQNEINLQQIECINSDKYVMNSAFVSDEGSEKIVVETFIDISEIKKAELELIQTNKTKDEFLGMISHEE